MAKFVRGVGVLLLVAAGIYYSLPFESQDMRSESAALSNESAPMRPPPIADYAAARKVFWRKLYNQPFTTLYCGEAHTKLPANGVNIEHVFPMGWVTNAMDCGTRNLCRYNPLFNRIEADLHNLYPSRTDVNEARESFRFGNIAGESRRFGAECDFEVDARQRVVEPRPAVRGDIARAMFYMVKQYPEAKLEIFAKQKALLKQWHKEDPPDAAEKARNDRIEFLQGNRNPFIDTPNLL